MSKWIDGEWLLDFFEPYPNDYHTPLGTLRACVDDAPSIDIVRCKECNMCDEEMWCSLYDIIMDSDDFCSYGERRE